MNYMYQFSQAFFL